MARLRLVNILLRKEPKRGGSSFGAVATLHLQLQARRPNPPGVPNLLSVAGDLSLPGQSPHSLIENGTARLDNTGLTIDLTTPTSVGSSR